jgi:hypothetical protein
MADSLAAIYEPQLLATLRASTAFTGITLPLPSYVSSTISIVDG